MVATYLPVSDFLPMFGKVKVETVNLENAAMFSVVYNLREKGNPVSRETDKVPIGEFSTNIYYNKDIDLFDTVDIKIYDSNGEVIATFEDVVLDII